MKKFINSLFVIYFISLVVSSGMFIREKGDDQWTKRSLNPNTKNFDCEDPSDILCDEVMNQEG